jgi:hypothetical protein
MVEHNPPTSEGFSQSIGRSFQDGVLTDMLAGCCGMGIMVRDDLVIVKALVPSGSAIKSGEVILLSLYIFFFYVKVEGYCKLWKIIIA